MEDRTTRLESAVEQLRLTVLSLQQRIDALEARTPGAATAGGTAVAEAADLPRAAMEPGTTPAGAPEKSQYDPIAILSLIGRLLLVLAGGFFLRAMTDTRVFAPPVGLSLGFAYALAWLAFTDRAGARRLVPSAVFHALATAMIAFPLVLEATTRFKVLTGGTSVVPIAFLTAAMLVVAWRQRLRAVAWIAVVAALPTSIVLLVQTNVVVPFALYFIAFGVATLWMGYALDWWGIRWPVALAADMAVAGVALRAFAPEHQDSPRVAMLLQLLLLGGYAGSIAIRTLGRDRKVTLFEALQTAAALVVGLGGAFFMMRATGMVPAGLGVASLIGGAACYAVAVMVIARREDHERNLYFYTTLALALVLAGFALALDLRWLGAAFAVLGTLAVGLWSRSGQLFMLLHGAAYGVAAGIVSGALGYCLLTLAAGAEGPWMLPTAAMLAVLVTAALSAGLVASRLQVEGDVLAIVPRFVIIVIFVCVVGGFVVGYVAPVAGGLPDGSVDAGILATVRTGVLAVATLLIAWMSRSSRFREWGWLVYPLLVGIGLKMMAQDFKYSRPATLFIAMALYGAALIIAPRLRRRSDKAAAQASA